MKAKHVILLSAAAGIACVLVIALAALIVTKKPADKAATVAAAAENKTLSINIKAAGYNEVTDSKFPIELEGADSSGKEIKQIVYITITNNTVEVPVGNYKVHPVASPLLSNGGLLALPEDQEVDLAKTDSTEFVYEKKALADITTEDLVAAKEQAKESGLSEEEIEKLSGPLTQATKYTAFMKQLKDMMAMGDDETVHGTIQVLSREKHAKVVCAFTDLDGDGVDELLVGSTFDSHDFNDNILLSQIFAVKDGKATLIAGLPGEGNEAAPGDNSVILLQGQKNLIACYNSDNPQKSLAYEVGPNGQLTEATLDNNHNYRQQDFKLDSDMQNVGIELQFRLPGTFVLYANELAHGMNPDDNASFELSSDGRTGLIDMDGQKRPLQLDTENHTISFDSDVYYHVNGQFQTGHIADTLSYDENTVFATGVGSAPFYGLRVVSAEDYVNGGGPGLSLIVKDDYLVGATTHS